MTTLFRRSLLGVSLGTRTRLATGGYDRTYDGLVSGWFACPACTTPPTPTPDLRVDGQPIDATKATTPRSDVPGGLGFLLRFTPTGTRSAEIRVQCPVHPKHGLDLHIPTGKWRTPAIAAIETSTWPHITGWLAHLTSFDGAIRLSIDGYAPIPVRTTVHRRDVQVYLGVLGVGGFHLDLGAHLGYALPDTTRIRLVLESQVLGEAIITDSPLGDDTPGCLPDVPTTSEPLEEATIQALRRRFRDTGIDTSGDWRDILALLGYRDSTAETEQWADYLAHHGHTPQQVSAWLALRASDALGVHALNPLPAALDECIDIEAPGLPERVRTWTEPILGIHNGTTTTNRLAAPPPTQIPDLDMKVAVAGLIHHKSGLGQNAVNSLKALDLAGIHACAAPFFPAPGGWNRRLGPNGDAIKSLEEHAVLLHLPIDQVIPSLTAQPTLLHTDRLIGFFMWELEAVPMQFHRALDTVDEIWTATEFVAHAFRKVTDTPVRVTGHAVDVSCVEEVTRAELGIAEGAFVVHYSFDANSTVARKNPNAALDAFHLAFDGDPSAVFVLKVRNFQQVEALARHGDPHAGGLMARLRDRPGVILLTQEWPHSRCLGLIAMADCFLSLHRSEGFGYSPMEANLLRTPVVVTGYSGALEWLDPSLTYTVPYDLVDLAPGEYFYYEHGARWAQPDIGEAVRWLRRLATSLIRKAGTTDRINRFDLGWLSEEYRRRLLISPLTEVCDQISPRYSDTSTVTWG